MLQKLADKLGISLMDALRYAIASQTALLDGKIQTGRYNFVTTKELLTFYQWRADLKKITLVDWMRDALKLWVAAEDVERAGGEVIFRSADGKERTVLII